jgi:tetratricopeptide (TPR) repeat protein
MAVGGSRDRAMKLRDKGFSWAQIVDVMALDHQASPLRLYRLAHRRSASDVVDEFNQMDPAGNATLRVQRLYDHEMWPEGGRRPTVRVLLALARIYQTAARRLVTDDTYASYTVGDRAEIDATDFRGLDPHHPRQSALLALSDGSPTGPVVSPPDSHIPAGDPPARDLVDRLNGPSRGESIDLFRAVTRLEPDPHQRETLFQLALVLGGISGLELAHRLSLDQRERLAQVTLLSRRGDAKVVAAFENVTSLCRELYESRGPEAVLKTVLRIRTVVAETLREMPRPAVRERLLGAYAGLSQLAGWLLYDLTRFSEANRCFKEGLTASQEAGDIPMTAFIHCCLSQMANFRNQIPRAIDHAYASRGWACRSGSATLASYASQIAAWAFAMDRDQRMTSRALNQAGDWLPDRPSGDDPNFVYFVDRGFTVGNRACCWLLLDRPKPALTAAEDAFELTNPTLIRNRGFRLLDQAKALVLQKEIEEGARLAEQVANIAASQHSVRLAQWLGDVRQLMQPWATTPGLRSLDERLAALGLASRVG